MKKSHPGNLRPKGEGNVRPSRRLRAEAARLLALLVGSPAARLLRVAPDDYRLSDAPDSVAASPELVRFLVAAGLLQSVGPGDFCAASVTKAWLARQAAPDRPFPAQHQTTELRPLAEEGGRHVLVNVDESPVTALAQRRGRDGKAWLQPAAIAAAERFRRDFEQGRLQPRITANWSASISMRKRSGEGGGAAELTDLALAARMRVDRAIAAVGPELAGVLLDVCCFLKGLETVERERQWPARSAKLALRFALDALARHYGLTASASGTPDARDIRHWGAEGYRPHIT